MASIDITQEVENITSYKYNFSLKAHINELMNDQYGRESAVSDAYYNIRSYYYDVVGRFLTSKKEELYPLLCGKYSVKTATILAKWLQTFSIEESKTFISMCEKDYLREKEIKDILSNLLYYDEGFLSSLESEMTKSPEIKVGKLIKKVAFENNFNKYKDEKIAQILAEKISPNLKCNDTEFFTADFMKPLNKTNWNRILLHAGNGSSCWSVTHGRGSYSMSSAYMSAIILNGKGKTVLFFLKEDEKTKIPKASEKPYIIVNDAKYFLSGRFWAIMDSKLNDWVYINYYNDTNASDSCYKSFLGASHSKFHMNPTRKAFINSDICYAKKDKKETVGVVPSPFANYVNHDGTISYRGKKLVSYEELYQQ